MSHVREALEPCRSGGHNTRLPLERAGYVLRLAEHELDASRFEALVVRGHDAGLHGDVLAAEDALGAALELWRGPALLEVRSYSAAHGAIARLDQLRLSALEELGEVRLALGKHVDLVDVLLQAVREFPLAERLTAQLMLALYRCGRQAEALRACTALARRLDDELATTPSAEVRRLEEDILLQRSRLDFVGVSSRIETSVSTLTAPRLVGRRAELGRLLDLYEGAAEGTRRVALISGMRGYREDRARQRVRPPGRPARRHGSRGVVRPRPRYAVADRRDPLRGAPPPRSRDPSGRVRGSRTPPSVAELRRSGARFAVSRTFRANSSD